ncbi:hypothetical protein JCM10212_006363 [Sporobolomyces blumeae]
MRAPITAHPRIEALAGNARRPAPISAFSTDTTIRSIRRTASNGSIELETPVEEDDAASCGGSDEAETVDDMAIASFEQPSTFTRRSIPACHNPPSPRLFSHPIGEDSSGLVSALILEEYETEPEFPWFSVGPSGLEHERLPLASQTQAQSDGAKRNRAGLDTPPTTPIPSSHHAFLSSFVAASPTSVTFDHIQFPSPPLQPLVPPRVSSGSRPSRPISPTTRTCRTCLDLLECLEQEQERNEALEGEVARLQRVVSILIGSSPSPVV